MRKQFFGTCGITYLDLNLLLDAKEDDKYKDWRSFMLAELENLWVGTRRFATRHPITHHRIPRVNIPSCYMTGENSVS